MERFSRTPARGSLSGSGTGSEPYPDGSAAGAGSIAARSRGPRLVGPGGCSGAAGSSARNVENRGVSGAALGAIQAPGSGLNRPGAGPSRPSGILRSRRSGGPTGARGGGSGAPGSTSSAPGAAGGGPLLSRWVASGSSARLALGAWAKPLLHAAARATRAEIPTSRARLMAAMPSAFPPAADYGRCGSSSSRRRPRPAGCGTSRSSAGSEG